VGANVDELETFYRDRFRAFASLATAVVGSPTDAHDVVQDAFVTAVRKRRTFRGDGSLEAWVWRIVLNKARDARRRQRPSAAAGASAGGSCASSCCSRRLGSVSVTEV
jgi:RNA polymerase sigma factor (sigma-70 family)